MRRTPCRVVLTLILTLAAGVATADEFVDAGRGPIQVHVPSSYRPQVPAPLVVLLHGYSSSGFLQEAYMQFLPLVEEEGFLYAYPDGVTDFFGLRYWNATGACCDLFNAGTDDSGYLSSLIAEIEAVLNVDPRRIHLIGHSNGGFMSYRMACDHSGTVASIASLAGATWNDPADCSPASPVHILQMHGTSDDVIFYDGGVVVGQDPYPGAVGSVEQWADFNACTVEGDTSPPNLDLDSGIAGAETEVTRYADQCDAGGSAELWTIQQGEHSPALSTDFAPAVVDYLFAHPKPGVACSLVDRFQAQCTQSGALRMRLVLVDDSEDGTTVRFDIDGDASTAVVRGNSARLSIPGQAGTGERTLSLDDPAGCMASIVVDCG